MEKLLKRHIQNVTLYKHYPTVNRLFSTGVSVETPVIKLRGEILGEICYVSK